jgi:hypothetical protein
LDGIEKILIDENRIRFHTRNIDQVMPAIIKLFEEQGVKMETINTLSPGLEDAFIKLTGLDSDLMKIDKPEKTPA